MLPLELIDLGERQVKNIEEPVRVYSVGPNSRPAATADAPRIVITDTVAMPLLPDKPSFAVLPFQKMSGDPEQEYFADGLVEDIITALSRFRSVAVRTARNSSFTYKGKAADIKQVGPVKDDDPLLIACPKCRSWPMAINVKRGCGGTNVRYGMSVLSVDRAKS